MRRRLLGTGKAHYHVVSRVVDRKFRFGEVERSRFRDMMWRIAEFSGVKVLTYAVMSNHFHILVEVPDKKTAQVSDEELLRRLGLIYSRQVVEYVEDQLTFWRGEGNDRMADAVRRRFLYRMHDLSEFMKTLKQRYSIWFNRCNDRHGTLWEERFRSVLIQPPDGSDIHAGRRSLLTIAAYIELNAVRAGIVADPRDYLWCGYGEAVAGNKAGRRGICTLMSVELPEWESASSVYRVQFFCKAGDSEFSREAMRQVLERGGTLSRAELLRCRVRYFTDGVVLGDRDFVDEAFVRRRDLFGQKRQSGARRMRGGDWDNLCTLRDLKVDVIS